MCMRFSWDLQEREIVWLCEAVWVGQSASQESILIQSIQYTDTEVKVRSG